MNDAFDIYGECEVINKVAKHSLKNPNPSLKPAYEFDNNQVVIRSRIKQAFTGGNSKNDE